MYSALDTAAHDQNMAKSDVREGGKTLLRLTFRESIQQLKDGVSS